MEDIFLIFKALPTQKPVLKCHLRLCWLNPLLFLPVRLKCLVANKTLKDNQLKSLLRLCGFRDFILLLKLLDDTFELVAT